jgi:hypothetical protein
MIYFEFKGAFTHHALFKYTCHCEQLTIHPSRLYINTMELLFSTHFSVFTAMHASLCQAPTKKGIQHFPESYKMQDELTKLIPLP